MSTFVKFFTKSKKSSGNKENHDESLKRGVNFERASTRSESGSDAQRERERVAMRAIPNPYSVWTEPKKTRGPSSCPGVALDSSSYERRSVRQPQQKKAERAGSVYGDMGYMRSYRIDGPADSSSSNHHSSSHRASRRYGDLSMIEERSERADRSMGQYEGGWSRSSTRRPATTTHYTDYTSGDSEDDEDAYVRKLQDKIHQLREDKSRYRFQLDNKKNELEYTQYELRNALERNSQLETQLKQYVRAAEKMERQLAVEREKTEMLEQRLSEMSSSTSNGAMERLVSSSETSLEMSREEEEEERRERDEVRNFRSAGVAAAAQPAAAAAQPERLQQSHPRDDDEMEVARKSETASPEFELRRSASDMGPISSFPSGCTAVDGAGEEMAVEGGGSWRRRRGERKSFVKRSMLPLQQGESESSDGEKILLTERQLKKKGAVVKYEPNRRIHVKEKHYRRFGKPERSALDRFTFLEAEVTDISGMLSSPNEGNY